MPGMKLRFLQNAQQRIATKKHIPATTLEAAIVYGTPAQRAKAVLKVVENAASLAQHRETHNLVCSVCDVTDRTKRCELLYALRSKLLELMQNRYGNVVMQKLLEGLPPLQRREIAEAVVAELPRIACNEFGNRVIQKLAEFTTSKEVITPELTARIERLAQHAVAQHAVARFVQVGAVEADVVLANADLMTAMLAMKESAVLTALAEVSTAAVIALLKPLVPTLIQEGRHHFALLAAVKHADSVQLGTLLAALKPKLAEMAALKGHAAVFAQLIATVSPSERAKLVRTLCASKGQIADVACDPYLTLGLRSAIETCITDVGCKAIDALCAEPAAVAQSSAGVPVLQRLLVFASPTQRQQLLKFVADHVEELATSVSGAHLVQSALDCGDAEVTRRIAQAVLRRVQELVFHDQGTFVVQKAFSHADHDDVSLACEALLEHLKAAALNTKASFAVAAALRAAKAADSAVLKNMMGTLKSIVMPLAVAPWSGRVVLDAMFAVGSTALKDAIHNVIFLKCEDFLADGPAESSGVGDKRGRNGAGENRVQRHRSE